MVSEPLIDLDTLLAPIPGDDPAGEPVPFQIREDLELLRKEILPEDFAPDDPARPTEAKYADWRAIIRKASDTLANTSKDLLTAARLTEALTREYGFAGLAEGFTLLQGMLRDCWDRMYPRFDPADPESLEDRAGPFNWLGINDRGALFPYTVRNVPLLQGENGPLSLQDWKLTQEGKGRSREEFDKAILSTSREECQHTFDEVSRAVEEFNALIALLNERLGSVSPGLTDLRAALGDCYALMRQILQQKGTAPAASWDEETAEAPASGEPNGEVAVASSRAPATRAEAYRRLTEAADLLEQLEPHSPIPYLVRRAVELGALPFPQLMRALIRNDDVIHEMNRELGIKE